MKLSLSQQTSSTFWEAQILDKTLNTYSNVKYPPSALVQSRNLKPRSDNSLSRLGSPGLNNTAHHLGQRLQSERTVQMEIKKVGNPTCCSQPGRNRAVFPGNHGRRQSKKISQICLRNDATAQIERPKGVISQATRSGVTMETAISGLVLSQIYWSMDSSEPLVIFEGAQNIQHFLVLVSQFQKDRALGWGGE